MMPLMGAILIIFLSTLSLRRATKTMDQFRAKSKNISIHALLAESDSLIILCPKAAPCISIHALLAESDTTPSAKVKSSP